ncbi:MAG: hypothetical protein CMO61_12200 [Verrucomicrobiales bacterium]|jgi:bacterioferritin-associated ferredoxin|nr:hypothetical protein [Verrucomicrobiales bacterium]|tara:strand:- start:30859 stop:31197 length:339 start_codon:yes stop_codon:yes gene_type:complete
MKKDSVTLKPTCRFATTTGKGEHLCHCAKVSESTVYEVISKGGVKSVEAIIRQTGAGSGCGACHCRINRLLQGLPAKCGGSFEYCHGCGAIAAICSCGSSEADAKKSATYAA